MQCQTIDEFIRGPEGQADKGMRPKLEKILADARAAGVDSLEIEIRTTPAGSSTSRAEGSRTCKASDPVDQLLEGLRRELEGSPGDNFHGELRLNFRRRGDSAQHLGSYTRQMRPPVSGQLLATGESGQLNTIKATVENAVRPIVDQMVRLGDVTVRVTEAAAKLVEASTPKANGYGDPKAQVLGDLVKGAMGIAAAERSANGGSPPIGPQLTQTSEPPAPPKASGQEPAPSSAASPPAQLPAPPPVDEAAVRAWLAQNRGRALEIGNSLLEEHNLQLVPR